MISGTVSSLRVRPWLAGILYVCAWGACRSTMDRGVPVGADPPDAAGIVGADTAAMMVVKQDSGHDDTAPILLPMADVRETNVDTSPPVSDSGQPDVAITATVDANSGPATRPTIANAVIWLESDLGLDVQNGAVARWKDQSGKGNDAVQNATASRPKYLDIASNGKPAVRFTGKKPDTVQNHEGSGGPWLVIADNKSVQWGTGDFTIVILASHRNKLDGSHTGGFGSFFGKYGPTREILVAGNWMKSETVEESYLQWSYTEGAGPRSKSQGYNDDKLRLMTYRRIASKKVTELRINGVAESASGSQVGSDISSPGRSIALGSFSAGSSDRCLDGDIQAVVAVGGPLDDSTLQQLERYLMTKYPVAPPPGRP